MASIAHISRLVILALLGLVAATFLEIPTQILPLIVLDSPLTLYFSSPWFMGAILVILVAAGTDLLIRLQPRISDTSFRATAPAWALPSVIAITSPFLIVRTEAGSPSWILVLAGAGSGLGLALLGEMHAAHPLNRHYGSARSVLTVLAYGAALVAFALIYGTHLRTAATGTATTVIAFVLAASLLREPAGQAGTPTGMRLPYAAGAGFLVGLATWGLNRVSVGGLVGGSLLLLVFYLATGLTQQLIHRKLDWRTGAEFAAVSLIGLIIIALLARL